MKILKPFLVLSLLFVFQFSYSADTLEVRNQKVVNNNPMIGDTTIISFENDSIYFTNVKSDYCGHVGLIGLFDKNGDTYNISIVDTASEVLLVDCMYSITVVLPDTLGDFFMLNMDGEYFEVLRPITDIESDKLSSFRIFPNPGTGIFTLSDIPVESKHIRILNAQGQTKKEILAESSEIDLSDLPAGVYHIVIQTAKKSYSKKLIIE